MSVDCSEGADSSLDDLSLNNDSRDCSRSSTVNYDARYIYRLKHAAKQLANSETNFYRVKKPLLGQLGKYCVSLSMDLIATSNTVFSMRRDDKMTLDNLVWTLHFAPFGFDGSQYMLELRVDSSLADDYNWQTEAHIRVAFGGHVLAPLLKFNHPVRFCAESPALVLFIVDAHTVKSWPSGLLQVDVYPETDKLHHGPLFCNKDDPDDIAIVVSLRKARRTFYVNRRWIEYNSDYFYHYLNSEFSCHNKITEVPVDDVDPREFLLLLRAMERFDEDEMLLPHRIEVLLKMISKFQVGPVQQQMIPAFKAMRTINDERKLLLAEKYNMPFHVSEWALNRCDPRSVRDSDAFDGLSYQMRQEILARIDRYPDDTVSNCGSSYKRSHY